MFKCSVRNYSLTSPSPAPSPPPPTSDSARSHVRGHLRLYHAYVADPSGLPDDDDSLQETAEHDPDWEVVEDGDADGTDGAAAQVPGGGESVVVVCVCVGGGGLMAGIGGERGIICNSRQNGGWNEMELSEMGRNETGRGEAGWDGTRLNSIGLNSIERDGTRTGLRWMSNQVVEVEESVLDLASAGTLTEWVPGRAYQQCLYTS